MKISNEMRVGILATFALVVLVLGFNFLKGNSLFTKNISLHSKYPNSDGLSPTNPVIQYGLKVGQVDKISLINEEENKILVEYHIYPNVILPANSIAKIISSDLLGSKAIELVTGDSAVLVVSGQELKGEVEASFTENIAKVMAPVQKKVEGLITSVDTVVTALNEVFNEDTRKDLTTSIRSVRNSLQQIEATTTTLNGFVTGETGRVRSILNNFEQISTNLRENNKTITAILNNVQGITDSLRAGNLKQTLAEANSAVKDMAAIIEKINAGQGSLGQLLNDDALFKNLDNATKRLDYLIADIKANPDRYLNFSVINLNRKKNSSVEPDSLQ